MKRILLAFDGQHFSEPVFEFALQLNQQEPIHATGIFLPSIDYVKLLYSFAGSISGPMYVTEVVKGDDTIVNTNVERFKELCWQNSIKCNVLRDGTGEVTTQVAEETRFADLLVLSGKSFYENLEDDTKEEYIADVLHQADCPVMVLPAEYKLPKSIVVAYDGSEQSIFALKQFANLFPVYKDVDILLAYFNTDDSEIPYVNQAEHYAALHFSKVTIQKFNIDAKKDLLHWIEKHGDTMLVTGAHSRSMLSEMFRGSFDKDIIHQHKIPVFVAHK